MLNYKNQQQGVLALKATENKMVSTDVCNDNVKSASTFEYV